MSTQLSTQRSFEPQLGRGGFLCLCGHVLLVVGDTERDETERTRVRDSHIRHRKPPLSPAPRLPRIATQYTDTPTERKRAHPSGDRHSAALVVLFQDRTQKNRSRLNLGFSLLLEIVFKLQKWPKTSIN